MKSLRLRFKVGREVRAPRPVVQPPPAQPVQIAPPAPAVPAAAGGSTRRAALPAAPSPDAAAQETAIARAPIP